MIEEDPSSAREAILGQEGVPGAAFQARSERSPDDHRIEACPRVAAFLARYLYSRPASEGIGKGGGRKVVRASHYAYGMHALFVFG
jgi:hypothetical protein